MLGKIKQIFTQDYVRYDGIRPINIYLMRLVYVLMVVFVGQDAWGYILTFDGVWGSYEAMAWSVWATFATLALVGVFRTVQMIPILLLEIFYKVLWLVIVAYPLWQNGKLEGSSAEGMTGAFIWVVLPIVVVPWRYVGSKLILGRSPKAEKR